MPEYRFYTLKKDGHLLGPPKEMECRSDEAAMEEAKQFLDGRIIEIWQGSRVVMRLEPK